MTERVTRHGLVQGRRGSTAAVVAAMLLMSFISVLHAASAPVLLLLEHTEAGKQIQTKIELKDGLVASPEKGKPQTKWIIRAGDALKSEVQPGDRSVNFYQSTGAQNTLLFIVKVRYYQNATGRWVPQFLLNEEPLVIRKNGRWLPLTTVQGVPNLIEHTGTALPNAEGYFPSLEFGMTTGATSIDAWLVQ
ncbi:MAG: hypothetical protein WB402_13985 [Sulfuricaulis sp.]|uniref:hypothetical protein n=1 Tax=Sulfuricaulis sp. TaxID=2003553 RepID=UPI003C66F2FC